ncbi:MAG: LysM peptidoglycan-binding domain-containing protein [Ruminococcus sp.]|nr:LysM peptidoglycan-binding domain-containing protein [Ruminococcus sp.]MDY4908992.1 LysM peptidoglycan-binding domain-containing protein [Candidatus Fimenecus sp.]
MYNSSTKKLKAVLVAILAIVLLVNAVLPMTVMGSSKKNTGDYQYYVIKSGDTLTRIAKTHGVTVSDIMTANNLSDADRIISGKVIKIPLTEESSASTWSSSRLSLNLVDANVKDALSAIARNAGYTIIFVGDATTTLTVNLEQMSALKAIDYVTRLAGLSYLKDGNTLMVGTTAELNEKFVDKVVMTKFTLKYITVGVLQTQASALGLSNVQYVSTEADDGTVFVSASPKELAKIQELIKLIDVSSNINAGAALVAANFKEINLEHITAEEFSSLLSSLGLDPGIVVASRPYTLYTFVTGSALADIKTIKAVIDKPLTGANLSASKSDQVVEPSTTPSSGTGEPATPGTSTGTPGTSTGTAETKILREVELEYIDRTMAVGIIDSFPYEVTVYGPEKMTKKLWLMGTESEVNKAESKIKEFDTESYADSMKLENTFFVYDLQNCTAQEMLDRLANINLENVTFKTNAYPTISKALIVYCDYAKQEQVKSLLDAMDMASTEEVLNRAVEVTANEAVARNRIAGLMSVHPEIPTMDQFTFVTADSKTGSGSACTTYVKATPEMADYIKGLLTELDSAA